MVWELCLFSYFGNNFKTLQGMGFKSLSILNLGTNFKTLQGNGGEKSFRAKPVYSLLLLYS